MAAGDGVILSGGAWGVKSGGAAAIKDSSGDCSECCGCTLPGTGDTLTVSFRNTDSCGGCYANGGGESITNINVDIDGDYTLSWDSDDGTYRHFGVTGAAVNSGQIDIHFFTDTCAGDPTTLSDGLLTIRAAFRLSDGCLYRLWANLDQAGDESWLFPFFMCSPFEGTSYELGVWHPTELSCGDPTAGGGFCAVGFQELAISEDTEAMVVID